MRYLILVTALLMTRVMAADSSSDAAVLSVMESRDALQGVSFARVVQETAGKRVLPVDMRQQADLLTQLGKALDRTLIELNRPSHPIHEAGRVNEASRYIEDEIRKQVNAIPNWKCTIPLTADGHEQRSGYPDLRIQTDRGIVFYLDPKLYKSGSRDSSLRTFYYEPKSLTGKIHDDAMHLLVGIEHAGTNANQIQLKSWELVDLSKLKVQLKAEFQASNRDVYREDMIVGKSKKN